MDESKRNVVIDIGSSSCQAGLAGDDAPTCIIPTLIGRPKTELLMPNGQPCEYIGEHTQKNRGILMLDHPIKHGIVTDWDGMEKIYHHIFHNEMRINPNEHPVLVTEPPLNPTANRENMIQLLFEKFQCPGFYVTIPAMLSLISSGRHAGVVVDSGEGVTHVVPIEGIYPISRAIRRVNTGGGELTHYLSRLLLQRGYHFSTSAEIEIVRDIKEKLAFIAEDYDKELNLAECSSGIEMTYKLPDGRIISIGKERFQCTEAIFDPLLMGLEQKGLCDLIHDSIMDCAIDLRRHYLCNVILAGGNTLFRGIGQRVTKGLKELTYPGNLVHVVQPPERKYSTWIGGSILASLSTFPPMLISKSEYEEHGSLILRRRCPY